MNDVVRVPATAATVIATSMPAASPADAKQTADVDEAHATVAQLERPSREVGVASCVPKSRPETVILQPVHGTALLSLVKLTTGAGPNKVCMNAPFLLKIQGTISVP